MNKHNNGARRILRHRTRRHFCLNLDVWTPAVNDNGKRSVMMWIHGSGFMVMEGLPPGGRLGG